MLRKLLVISGAICMLSVSTLAVPVINVGEHNLQANTPGQTIPFYVTGSDLVQGLNFYIQVGDGGSANNGTDTMPLITNVGIIGTGTIFSQNNYGVSSINYGLISYAGTTTNSGTVVADGILAYVTIDTTGTVAGESYDLLLTGVAKGAMGGNGISTDFAGIPAEITNGTINIVPEPATLTLLGTIGLNVLIRRRR